MNVVQQEELNSELKDNYAFEAIRVKEHKRFNGDRPNCDILGYN